MKSKIVYALIICLSILPHLLVAQNVGINSDGTAPENSAMLDIKSSEKGILIPRMTTVQRMAIVSPADGLMVYDITTAGFWYYNGTGWIQVGAASGWSLTGNTDTDTTVNFIGTTDDKPLLFRINNEASGIIDGYRSLASFGDAALRSNTTGTQNTAIGSSALQENLNGPRNTAIGSSALQQNSSGSANTAVGTSALQQLSEGNSNTAIGSSAMQEMGHGDNNIAMGEYAMGEADYANRNIAIGSSALTVSDGDDNIAIGSSAMYEFVDGGYNIAVGHNAMGEATGGSGNTALGNAALANNTNGGDNIAIGAESLMENLSGYDNIAAGSGSLTSNRHGFDNIAIGRNALSSSRLQIEQVAIGAFALQHSGLGTVTYSSAEKNTAVGFSTLRENTTGYRNTAIGSDASRYNISGGDNTALGVSALAYDTSGNKNTAIGVGAIAHNKGGDNNTATGYHTLFNNNTGNDNTAVGSEALYQNTTGNGNTAVGEFSSYSNTTGSGNTSVGRSSYVGTTGSNNTSIGNSAGPTYSSLDNATAIGYDADVDASNKVRIGNTSVTSIGGEVGWTTFSDARFKRNIKENVPGLDFISKLQPVTYTVDVAGISNYYKSNIGSDAGFKDQQVRTDINPLAFTNIQSGFLAQDVEKVAKELGYDFSGVDVPTNDKALYGLRYADFVVPMVKAIQEQQVMIEELKKEIRLLKAGAK